jgi:hypothetical protein
MLLALALYASPAHAGIAAGFGETPGVVDELYHDSSKRLLLRLPFQRRGAYSPGPSAGATRSRPLDLA